MKKITKQEYYQVVGLLTLSKEYNRTRKVIEQSLARVLGQPKDAYEYYGHVTDAIYSDYSADELLSKMEIEVNNG